MATEQCPGGTTGAKVRKGTHSRKLESSSQARGRTATVVHHSMMFGTGSLNFQTRDLRPQDLADGASHPGGTVIEISPSAGPRECKRRRSGAERWRAFEVGEKFGEADARELQKTEMEEESETRALLVSCPLTTQSALPGPLQRLNRHSLQRL